MKKVLSVIGIALLAGVTVYIFLNRTQKTPNPTVTTVKKEPDDISLDSRLSIISPDDVGSDGVGFDNAKSSAISNIASRHEGAAKIIKDAAEAIYKRSGILVNEDDLEQISVGLNELLGEEK